MAFSLSNWFKGKPGAPGNENPDENPSPATSSPAPATVAPAPPTMPPPAAVRKVMPNSVQPVSLRTPGSMRPVALPVSSPTPASERVSPTVSAPRPKISFGGTESGAPGTLTAPEPPAAISDVTVSLVVGDFLDRLPPTFVQPGNVDRQRRVDFRASELYSDLTKGRASVPASVIYQKCPELFSRPVTEEEDTEVSLPLQKLVEQMSQAFQTRADQVAEENVGEIETPFLQVAMEDSARLPKAQGTTAGALRSANPLAPSATVASPLNEPLQRPHRTGQISTISPPKTNPEPAPTQAAPSASTVAPINAAKRPPSTVRASVAGGKIRLSGPAMPNRMAPVNPQPAAPPAAEAAAALAPELPPSASQRILPPLQVPGGPTASPSHQVSKKTARIQIPPISLKGAGPTARPAAPSAVSVQPSPVPVRPGPSAEPTVPPISFRSMPPPPGTKRMPHTFAPPPPRPVVPPPAFPAVAPFSATPPTPVSPIPSGFPASTDDRKISLSLAAILRGLPLSSLTVEPTSVPDEIRVTLPFSLVEPQLAQGRVSVPHAVFVGSLPESHREVLASNSGLSEIPLPLQEVFQNLPAAALAIRQDQVTEEVSQIFPTPFSQKAEEDAQRLGTPAAEVAPATVAAPPTPEKMTMPAPEVVADAPPPAEPAPEEQTAEPTAVASAKPEAAAEEPETAPSEEFANLFVEEPAPARDLPMDFGGDTAVEDEKPAAPESVEAKASSEDPKAETKPEAVVEQKPEPVPELKLEPSPESKVESTEPEQKPEEQIEEKAIVEQPAAEVVPAMSAQDEKLEEPAPKLESKTSDSEVPTHKEESKPVDAESAAPVLKTQQKDDAPETPVVSNRKAVPAPITVHDSALQSLFMTEDELDAKGVVRHVCTLPGVEGCSVMFEDGLQLAGNFPSEADVEGFSAMAPPFFKRTRNFTGETNLGSLRAFTLYTESGLYSFFMHEQICLSVHHAGRGFLPGVREKLEVVTRELARMYASV